MFTLSARQPDWQQAIKYLAITTEAKVAKVMDSVGSETIKYLQSFIALSHPPGRPRVGPFHPGGWRDQSKSLSEGYNYTVTPVRGGTRLAIRNDDQEASYLEHRNGFFVVGGVTDPGGPVETALVAAAAVIAPEWVVARGKKRSR